MASPIAKAFLLCDQVIKEEKTNKHSVIGIFNNINSKKFPVVHGKFCVFIEFIELLGSIEFKLELSNMSDGTICCTANIPAQEFSDRLKPHNLIFTFNNQEFKNPGQYEFRIFANKDLCGSKTINLLQPGK